MLGWRVRVDLQPEAELGGRPRLGFVGDLDDDETHDLALPGGPSADLAGWSPDGLAGGRAPGMLPVDVPRAHSIDTDGVRDVAVAARECWSISGAAFIFPEP